MRLGTTEKGRCGGIVSAELLGVEDVSRSGYGDSTGAASAARSVEVVLCLTRGSVEVLELRSSLGGTCGSGRA